MKFVTSCLFLKMELKKSKDNKEYGIVSLLDDDQNSYKFFVFDELKNKFVSSNFQFAQKLDCAFQLSQYNNNWQVNLLDFKRVDNNGK